LDAKNRRSSCPAALVEFEFAMPTWIVMLRFVRDNITLVAFFLVLFILGAAWIVFEAYRGYRSRAELDALRRTVRDLKTAQPSPARPSPDPVVLTSRWVQSGQAATTSDGGCLVMIDRVSPALDCADLTVRIDGATCLQNHKLRVGQNLEAKGKFGTYTLELSSVEGLQAKVAIALRNRHNDRGHR
jgi:hypothetical protein